MSTRKRAPRKWRGALSRNESAIEMFGQMVAEALREALTEAIQGFGDTAPALTVASTAPESLPEAGQAAWFSMLFEGSLQGRAYLAVKTEEIASFGMRETASSSAKETGALTGLLQTMATQLQKLMTRRYGPVTATLEQATRPALSSLGLLRISTQPEEGKPAATLYVLAEEPLVASFGVGAGGLFPEVMPSGQTVAENFDLVLGVELNATLRFGQRQLSLREILELTSGSVVELDRQVDEPVELVLDGRVIARGEAVIIDGNYGMRITEVLQLVNGVARGK